MQTHAGVQNRNSSYFAAYSRGSKPRPPPPSAQSWAPGPLLSPQLPQPRPCRPGPSTCPASRRAELLGLTPTARPATCPPQPDRRDPGSPRRQEAGKRPAAHHCAQGHSTPQIQSPDHSERHHATAGTAPARRLPAPGEGASASWELGRRRPQGWGGRRGRGAERCPLPSWPTESGARAR